MTVKETMDLASMKSSPEIRGKRLKSLRRLADLSRKGMERKYNVSAGTLQGWEDGRYGGLTPKGAQIVLDKLKGEGIFCDSDWLLHGIGDGPRFSDKLFFDESGLLRHPTSNGIGYRAPQSAIAEELLFFRKHNSDVIDMVINDDGMEPFYVKGAYVAGQRRYADKLHTVVGHDCIVQTKEGETIARRVREGSEPGVYTLVCINSNAQVDRPTIYDCELICAAPIIWYRRVDP